MLFLILSILLIITSSLALNTYVRLHNASKTYPSPDAFEDACNMSKTYVIGSEILMILVLVFAVGLMLLSVWQMRAN
jgi:uncharacterized membrane protein